MSCITSTTATLLSLVFPTKMKITTPQQPPKNRFATETPKKKKTFFSFPRRHVPGDQDAGDQEDNAIDGHCTRIGASFTSEERVMEGLCFFGLLWFGFGCVCVHLFPKRLLALPFSITTQQGRVALMSYHTTKLWA